LCAAVDRLVDVFGGDKGYHTGKLATGVTIDEVWERVKPSEQGKAQVP
jgi:hypothetical protein